MNAALRILQLEDDPGDARLIRDTLKSEGFNVKATMVSTEVTFRSELKSGRYDLILADHKLPGFSGMEALAIVRNQHPKTPFIFVTGALSEDRVVEMLKAGASDLVLKDRLSRLGLAVRAALANTEKIKLDPVEASRTALLPTPVSQRLRTTQPVEGIPSIAFNETQMRRAALRSFWILGGVLFAAEFLVMYGLAWMPQVPAWFHNALDALLMSLLAFPLLYWLAIRPLQEQIRERSRIEATLREHRERLEEMVAEATAELTASNQQLRNTVAEQRRAEEALRESEEHVRQALLVGRMFAFHWDAKTDRTIRSSDYADMLGFPKGDPPSRTSPQFQDRIEAADREALLALIAGLQPASDRYHTTFRFNRPDGSKLILEETGRGVFDAHGQLAGVVGITADVTAREEAQAALERELAVKDAVTRVSTFLLAPEINIAQVAEAILGEAKALTGSREGLVCSFDAETKECVCHALSRGVRRMCKGESSGPWGIFPRVTGDRHSICRDALHSRSGFFDNQPERPLSGEEPLAERFLTVPAYLGKDRVGQIVVLNSRRDYSPTDISALARLAERYALGIQRLRFKHALKAERDFVQAILATAPALVLVLDPAGRIVGFNRACEAASGHGFAEVAGKFAWEFLSDPGEAEAQKRLFTRLLAGEAPLSYEGLWVARNGVRRRILWSSTTLKGDNNAIQNVIATGLDVTETRDAEDKLRVLTRAMESGPCSVVITDGKGILTYVNPAFAQLSGYTAGELIGQSPRIWKSGRHSPEYYKALWQSLSKGEEWRGEFCDRKKNGELFWIYSTISPIKDDSGRISHYVSVIIDITERKRYEGALEEARRNLEDKVAWRTADLEKSVQSLRQEVAARRRVETEIQAMLEFERLVAEIATDFSELQTREFDTIVRRGGRRLMEFLGADRVSLLEFVGNEIRVTVSLSSEGIPAIEQQLIPNDTLPWSQAQIRAGQTICFSTPDELPADAEADRATYRRFGTQSLIVLPLPVTSDTLGALVFATVKRQVTWPPQTVQRLHVVEELFAGLLLRWRSQRALSEAEARYHTLADFIQDWEFWESPDGSMLFCSPACERITGYPPQRFLVEPRLLDEIVLPEDATLWRDFHRRALLQPEARSCQFRICREDGQVRWIQHHSQPVFDEAGRFQGLRASHRDHTAEKKSELESQRLRDELARLTRIITADHLAASLAHELRQPLAAILSNAEAAQQFLNQENADLNEVREALNDIVQNDERASQVIQRLRALCRLAEREKTEMHLNQLIEETLSLLRSELILRQVSWRQNLAPELPSVAGNRIEIQQVLVNLLVNARDAMMEKKPDTRRLTVTSAFEKDCARVSVTDTGGGISPAAMPHLFQPFHTTKTSGMGLGLAISRTIIEAHGGRFWAENNPEGGATFHFTLPLWTHNAL